jgi:glutathione peroxidase-family protein
MLSFFDKPAVAQESIYEFRMPSITGKEIDFSIYRGKWMLIVNTASKCGYTPQYKELQRLHELYGNKIVVLGFPANNFFWQEPGSNNQIEEFCEKNYGVKFQMFQKISVRGSDKPAVPLAGRKDRQISRVEFLEIPGSPRRHRCFLLSFQRESA